MDMTGQVSPKNHIPCQPETMTKPCNVLDVRNKSKANIWESCVTEIKQDNKYHWG